MSTPQSMRAIVAKANEPLKVHSVPLPVLGRNDVLIKVAAAGLNRADLIQRTGNYPPPPGASDIMGLEVSGTITKTGSDVARWSVGDNVCALLSGGGYAEYASADAGALLPIPDGMDMVHAACFPESLFTVWANVFNRGGLRKGEDFLCHGGTSGIGVMAIQMARHFGASKIYATAGTTEKCELAKNLGADMAINYKEDDFEERVKEAGGVDVILDMVGGDYIQKNINCAKLNGRIVNIAYQNGFTAEVNFVPVLMKRLSLNATTLRARSANEKRTIRDAIETEFWPLVLRETLKPVLDRSFAFEEAEAAQAYMQSGKHSGKIILKM